MGKVNAYWISPDSKIYPVPRTHIQFIIENTELFDLEKEYIQEVYDSYNEKIPFEGKARKSILIDQLGKGWIRIRFNPKTNNWHINYSGTLRNVKQDLKNWMLVKKVCEEHIKYISLNCLSY